MLLLAVASFALIAPALAQDSGRPLGWSEASHSQNADPDYERLFAMDRVHELYISIAPEDFAAMQSNLQEIGPGALAGRGGFAVFGRGANPGAVPGAVPAPGPGAGPVLIPGPGAGPVPIPGPAAGPGRGEPGPALDVFGGLARSMAEASQVCAEQGAGAACSIAGTPGQCQAAFGAELICTPEIVANFASGRGGAPNLITQDPIYVPVTVTYDGRTWPGVGMRYKGNSSLMTAIMSGNGKVPFRLDFDRYEDELPETRNQRFFGFHKLTFSSNFSDDSMLKEVLATELFRDFGVPAARAAFYRVFVDVGGGYEYWGLYSMIEDPADGAMLDSQFLSGEGNLYKPDGPGANWTFFEAGGFPKKTNEKAGDFSDVAAAIDALHSSRADPALWRERLEKTFDVEIFLRWLAVNSAIENWDSYGRLPHNYYVYGDPGDGGRLKWIPWDHNMSFGMAGGGINGVAFGGPLGRGMGRGGFGGAEFQIPEALQDLIDNLGANAPPMAFMGGAGDDILHAGAGDAWPLIGYLLADEVYAGRYRELLEQSLEGLFAPESFEARARELHALIAPYVVGELGERPTHTTLSSPGAFESSLNALLEQSRIRRQRVRAALVSAE